MGTAARTALIAGGVALVVILLGGLAVWATVQRTAPGTTLAGEPVSDPEEAVVLAEQLADRLAGLPVTVAAGQRQVSTTAGELGATFDVAGVDRAAQQATGLDDWLARTTGGEPISLPTGVFFTTGNSAEVADELQSEPTDGGIDITAAGVRVTEPVEGVTVEATTVGEAFREAVTVLERTDLAAWPDTLEVSVEAETAQPTITRASIDAALSEIEALTDTPVELTAEVLPEDPQTIDGQGVPTRETITLELGEDELVQLLAVEVDPEAIERQRLVVVPSTSTPPPSLIAFLDRAAVGPDIAARVTNRSPTPTRIPPEQAQDLGPGGPADHPSYADVSTVSGEVEAEVVEPGLDPSVEDTAEAIVAAMQADEATAEVQGEPVTEFDLATDFGIVEPISTFTTFYEPGQSRVTNIHRIAEIVDGALVPPGGNYDLNHAVGERTSADGFVSAGAILEGEFISDIGGGVSQFGTTFFNAMWFSGIDIITHTPHSFYFERYPAGREATIDYPGVDLELNNNTPNWILIDTAVTDSSVTVTFWSTDWFDVETTMGERTPTDQGFRMQIARTARGQGGLVDDDQFTISYRLP